MSPISHLDRLRAKEAARKPATDRQRTALAERMTAAGVSVTDPEWPATVSQVCGAAVGPDPATWTQAAASRMLTALDTFLARCGACGGHGDTGPVYDPDPCGYCRGTGRLAP